MEEDLMLPPLDLAELELNAGLSIGSIVGIDPKLGGFGDFRSFDRRKERSKLLPTTVPSSDASKRARASPGNGNRRTVSCLVEGCLSDLSKCREYNMRHKVCEAHSKTAVVMVDGRVQRFCQQCSRFHLLAEFDEVKRSCRRKLAGHNKRRRKPQPHLDKGRAESLITNHQGSGAEFYLYPRMFPAAAPEFMWAGTVESKEIAICPNPHLIDRKRNFHGKRFPFLQDSDDALSSSSFAFGSDCAPSLLSSSSEASFVETGGQMAPADRIPIAQPMIAGLQAGFNCSVTEDGYMSAVFDTDLHCQGLHVHGKSQGHPFSW